MSGCEEDISCAEPVVWEVTGWDKRMKEGFKRLCRIHVGDEAYEGATRRRISDVWHFEGGRVKWARQLRKKTREELAADLGITEYDLWKFEMGQSELTFELQVRIVHLLDFGPAWYERPLREDWDTLKGNSLVYHVPYEELCSVCKERWVAALCDAKIGRKLCSARLCDYCRYRPNAQHDYCPAHKGGPVQASLI